MNPITDKIVPKHTGRFRVSGVGRVGTYEAARKARRCRARQHWVIEEELAEVVVTKGVKDGMSFEQRRKEQVREDFGQFKTKTAAIQFMKDAALAHGYVLEGDLTGYPTLVVPMPPCAPPKMMDPYKTICVVKANGKKVGSIPAASPKAQAYITELTRHYGTVEVVYEEDPTGGLLLSLHM